MLVELAFLVPILAGLALGVIEMGRYAYAGILIGNAAEAGAAYGSQSLPQSVDTAGITKAAGYDYAGATTTSANNGFKGNTLTVNSSLACGCDVGGAVTAIGCNAANAGTCNTGHWVIVLSVTASGTFSSMFNYPGIPSSIAMSRTSSMRVAQNWWEDGKTLLITAYFADDERVDHKPALAWLSSVSV
jgi:Flp pilus assembly protein TadG